MCASAQHSLVINCGHRVMDDDKSEFSSTCPSEQSGKTLWINKSAWIPSCLHWKEEQKSSVFLSVFCWSLTWFCFGSDSCWCVEYSVPYFMRLNVEFVSFEPVHCFLCTLSLSGFPVKCLPVLSGTAGGAMLSFLLSSLCSCSQPHC